MARKNSVPNYSELITVTYAALKALGGSGKNDEINNKAAEILGLSDDVLEVPHLNSSSLSEINYRLAWARTLLKRSGAIANSARAVWAISPSFSDVAEVDGAAINKAYHKLNAPKKDIPADADPEDMPEEVRPWRKKLYEVLIHMDPYALPMKIGVSYGSGALKALQNDNIPELDLLVREAIQNSSDAAINQPGDSCNINFTQGSFSPNAVVNGKLVIRTANRKYRCSIKETKKTTKN